MPRYNLNKTADYKVKVFNSKYNRYETVFEAREYAPCVVYCKVNLKNTPCVITQNGSQVYP